MDERYIQQIPLAEIGVEGQGKIAGSKVLVIGAGGLGSFVVSNLVAAGVGKLGIVDHDHIERSNLHRQIFYAEDDIGKPKTTVLADKLSNRNSGVTIESFEVKFDKETGLNIVPGYDIVCDCTDNLDARISINNLCRMYNKPLVYAAVAGWEGYITVLHHRKKVSLEEVFSMEAYAKNSIVSCSNGGIIGTTCAVAGSIQANEVLKITLDRDEIIDGILLCFNILGNVFRQFKIIRADNTLQNRNN